MDTGGLNANPGGGFGMPSPSPMPPVTNNYNTSRTFNNRTNQMFDRAQKHNEHRQLDDPTWASECNAKQKHS